MPNDLDTLYVCGSIMSVLGRCTIQDHSRGNYIRIPTKYTGRGKYEHKKDTFNSIVRNTEGVSVTGKVSVGVTMRVVVTVR